MPTLRSKQKKLDQIAIEIANDRIAKRGTIGKSVPGEGNPDAEIVFVGEAPGRKEAQTGRPFIGPAGKLLRAGLAEIGLDDKNVFITSACKYLPKQITPTPAQIEYGKKYLYRQIEVIEPEIIVVLGRVAALSLLDRSVQMTKEHGTIIEKEGRKYFLMLHPAASLHQPKLKPEFLDDFTKLKKFIARNRKTIK